MVCFSRVYKLLGNLFMGTCRHWSYKLANLTLTEKQTPFRPQMALAVDAGTTPTSSLGYSLMNWQSSLPECLSTTCREQSDNKLIISRKWKAHNQQNVHPSYSATVLHLLQVIKMLILVAVLFLVCWGLPIIMQVIIKFNLHSFTPTVYTLRVSFNLLPFIHACINPFIYSFMSKNFRRAFRRQLEKMGFRKRSRQGSGSRNGHGSLTRTSRMQRSTPTMQRFRMKPGHTSSSSSTTNCLTDTTKHTDAEQTFLTLHSATSAVWVLIHFTFATSFVTKWS